MPSAAEKQEFLAFLRGRRLRVTGERLVLLDEIFSQHGHLQPEQLLDGLQARGCKISRATIYRNLELMVEAGLVRKVRIGRRHLYEHLHSGQEHDHLVCTDCGHMVEFVSRGIAALQGEICRAHGFVPTRHQLQILGLCRRCAEGELAHA